MKNKAQRQHSALALKFTLGFLLLGILICAACSFIGYRQYKASLQKLYNTTAYDIAESVEEYIALEDLEYYVDAAHKYVAGELTDEDVAAIMADDTYQSIHDLMVNLRKSHDANDIFLIYVDLDIMNSYDSSWGDEELSAWRPTVYMFDSYVIEEECYPLGASARFNPAFLEDTVQMFTTGDRPDNYFISESQYGYNTSAMLPVKDNNGNVIAAIGVEIPMLTLQQNLRQYLFNNILTTFLVVALVIAVFLLIIYRSLIQPINAMSAAANEFVNNENQLPADLKAIKTGDEVQNLAENIMKMQVDITEYITNLTKVTAEKERIGAELDVARNIQASMLPCVFPAFPDREEFDIFATMNPAKEVGGDFYDFFMVDKSHVAIVMADVSGKGVPAALFMVIGKTLIKDHTDPSASLSDVFTEVNNLLCEANSEGLFITAFEGVLDLETGEFDFVNAGHELPVIYRKNGSYEYFKTKPGFVLAGMEGMRFRGGSLQLNEGDKLFQYTDGITEATDANNCLYGMERLEAILNKCCDSTPEETCHAVKADIDRFVGDAPQFDDITMLCLELKKFYRKPEEPEAK